MTTNWTATNQAMNLTVSFGQAVTVSKQPATRLTRRVDPQEIKADRAARVQAPLYKPDGKRGERIGGIDI